ncbi:MAG: hypothetical protein DWH97_02250 [Planctomycetota bacterium]|nr:MAG: hypothetical protein DWH97_02250 [Planctomycetota bacterium]
MQKLRNEFTSKKVSSILMSTPVQTRAVPTAESAYSTHSVSTTAAHEIAASLAARCLTRPSVLVVFGSFHHRALFSDALEVFRDVLRPVHLLASTAEGVTHDARNIEEGPGLTAIALTLPHTSIHPFWFELDDGPPSVWSDAFIRERITLPGDLGALRHAGILMIADPRSIQLDEALTAIDASAGPMGAQIRGAVTGDRRHAGLHVLAVNRKITHTGLVGLSIFGDVEIGGIVSHAMTPVGARLTITRAARNEIIELNNRPALTVMTEALHNFSAARRQLMAHGIWVSIEQTCSTTASVHTGFLTREILRIDEARGSLLTAQLVREGSRVRFALMDPEHAHDDLDMALEAEQSHAKPAAVLVCSSASRQQESFAAPDTEVELIARRLGRTPSIGLHGVGAIGPAGNRAYALDGMVSVITLRAHGS